MATTLGDTSGTVGQTVLDITAIIEHAVRRCGVSAAVISAEQQQSARENLFLILSNLATRGLSLWCVTKLTMGLEVGKTTYTLPVGTVDVLVALLRRATAAAATTLGAGEARVALAEAAEISSALIRPEVAGTYALALQSSDDGVVWVTRGTAVVVFDGDTTVGLEANTVVSALHFRVVDSRDPTRLFVSGTFYSNPYDIPMSKLSRDDYTMLPNKTFTSQWPLQFWYDKQFYRPQVSVWPLPTEQIPLRMYLQSHIQDPGPFVSAVQVPQRWLDTIISLLAPRVCLELPANLVPPDRYDKLVGVAEKTLREAEDSETDGAPIRLAPSIGCYTR
jgi:hypothetical protein